MRLYVFLTFLIVLIIAVNAAQQNHPNKRTQLAKRKSTNGAVAANSNHLVKAKPRPRSASKSKKVRKIKPARKPISKKVVRRVVKKNNRRSNAPKKIIRKGNRNNLRRSSRAGSPRGSSRKRLAKQELSDSSENKSIGAGQANGSDLDTSSDKAPETTNNQAAPAKPVATPVQPSVAKPVSTQPVANPPSAPSAAQPSVPAASDEKTSLLSSPAANGNPLSSSPFNIPKATGENQAIGAAFSQSSNGGSAFAAGFASIGKQNTAGGVGQVNAGKQASNPGSETLNSAEEPAASDTSSSADEGSNDQLAAFRRRPRHG